MDLDEVFGWLRRLIYLDTSVFDEIRSNPSATISGVLVVIVSTLLAGFGGWLWWWMNDFGSNSDIFIHSVLVGSALAVFFWAIWVLAVFIILTQFFRERAFFEQLVRVMGVASVPLALMLLMVVPGVSFAVGVAALVLTFSLTTIALMSATTADPARVLFANFVGFLIWAAALTLLSTTNLSSPKPHAPGIFLYNTVETFTDDLLEVTVIE